MQIGVTKTSKFWRCVITVLFLNVFLCFTWSNTSHKENASWDVLTLISEY